MRGGRGQWGGGSLEGGVQLLERQTTCLGHRSPFPRGAVRLWCAVWSASRPRRGHHNPAGLGQAPHLEGQVRLRQEQPRRLVQVHRQQHLGLEGPQPGEGRSLQASPRLSVQLQNLEDTPA